MNKLIQAVRSGKIVEVDDTEADLELTSPSRLFGSHPNLLPMQNAVQGPRAFYGSRFYNQSMPHKNAEAPLVQALDDEDPQGRSRDEIHGELMGARRAKVGGVVKKIDKGAIVLQGDDGQEHKVPLYNNFYMNRKTAWSNEPVVKAGDRVEPGSLLARSNYTDANGTMAMGLNARVGLVPYKGYSMDDAIVFSEGFAKRLVSKHAVNHSVDWDMGLKGGKSHFHSIFPSKFTQDQLKKMDDDGVVLPGTVLREGDPLVLATRPRTISSSASQLGKLSKAMRQARSDASEKWDHEDEGVVTDVVKTSKGVKVYVQYEAPSRLGDKAVLRHGQKGILSKIIPDDRMPRTIDGKPLDVLLNPLGLPSRANNATVYELLLGKAAEKDGKPMKVPTFNKKGEKWYDFVRAELEKRGLSETERVFDPETNKELENPITVGNGHIMKLHHVAASKASARGTAAYSADEQPLKGGSEAAQAKRMSGLETHALMSAGAYGVLREGSTIRGQKNDEFWRALRMGQIPKEPGAPFVWKKFRTLLAGAGMKTTDLPGGRIRLGPMTDDDVSKLGGVEITHGGMVDPVTLEPMQGGLFDTSLVGSGKWGYMKLPKPVPNPAFETEVRRLLGLTEKEFREVMAGRKHLE